MNNNGPSIEPCGTPISSEQLSEYLSLTETLKRSLV